MGKTHYDIDFFFFIWLLFLSFIVFLAILLFCMLITRLNFFFQKSRKALLLFKDKKAKIIAFFHPNWYYNSNDYVLFSDGGAGGEKVLF